MMNNTYSYNDIFAATAFPVSVPQKNANIANSAIFLLSDIYRFKFLESRGWLIVRVWSRDWWLSRDKVLTELVNVIERQKSVLREKINANN